MSNVVSFASHRSGGKTFLVDRFVPEGRKRRQWAVIIREPDGSEGYHLVRSEKDAIWLAGVLRKAEADRQKEWEALERHPIGKTILSVDTPTRDTIRRILIAEARLRGVTD